MRGKIVAVSVSEERGTKKENIKQGILIRDFGLNGDAHAGDWNRQVSLLALESIEKIKNLGLQVVPGDFAENLTVSGMNLLSLAIGERIKVGKRVVLEITQIGKICHDRCNIYKQVGDCVMPREGIFAKVIKGGKVKVGDLIETYVGTVSNRANGSTI